MKLRKLCICACSGHYYLQVDNNSEKLKRVQTVQTLLTAKQWTWKTKEWNSYTEVSKYNSWDLTIKFTNILMRKNKVMKKLLYNFNCNYISWQFQERKKWRN